MLGLDHRDEVWDGVLHVNPPPGKEHIRIASRLEDLLKPLAAAATMEVLREAGLGEGATDYRTPDLIVLPVDDEPQWSASAALAVEVVSPGDASWEKFDYYAAHEVDEVVIVDPPARAVHWFRLGSDGRYEAADQSRVLDLTAAAVSAFLGWT